jgi:hypothetical protein
MTSANCSAVGFTSSTFDLLGEGWVSGGQRPQFGDLVGADEERDLGRDLIWSHHATSFRSLFRLSFSA